MRPAPLAKLAIASLILLTTAASGLATTLPVAAATRQPTAVTRMAGHHPLAFISHHRVPPLPAGEKYACPVPTRPGQMQCMSIIPTGSIKAAASGMLPNAATPTGYGPADLRSAYKLATAAAANGAGMTVGIVDAYADPKAAADLATYRKHYGLPACTTATKCLRIVNQNGAASPLPTANSGWALEISLDLEMVSAICPKCKIVLVEARSSSILDLGTAENTAVALGAKFVSNSWGGGEFIGEQAFDRYFNHPGVAITFAAGDYGYGTQYPADIQYVTAVGGTLLSKAKNTRGWTESAWGDGSTMGTGSGCSVIAAKATWQTVDATFPNGCLNRTGNDVSAVASPAHGVAVYDSYALCGGWCNPSVGGTSASSPIIAATYALAGPPSAGTYPASYPYLHSKQFFDPSAGSNIVTGSLGTCETNRAYLCHGVAGYDGPTGLGTPNGIGGFANAGAQVTLLAPGTQDVAGGTSFSLRISGYDTSAAATSLTYSATGLPAGLSIGSVTGSRDGLISGTTPAGPGSYQVVVTATDATTGKSGVASFLIAISAPLNTLTAQYGLLLMSNYQLCLTDPGTAGGQATVVTCYTGTSQNFAVIPGAAPGANDALKSSSSGLCLAESATTNGASVTLQTCDGSPTQQWLSGGLGLVVNATSGLCLGDQGNSTASGTAVQVQTCAFSPTTGLPSLAGQTWALPAGPVQNGRGECLTETASYSAVSSTACDGAANQAFTWMSAGTVGSPVTGQCLSVSGSAGSGQVVSEQTCNGSDPGQIWFPGPGGQLYNEFGKCLYSPALGASVVQQDCYGMPGEIWAIG